MLPMVSALKHHKTTVILVALEIALTCAIITNALFLIGDRLGAMSVATGVADNELVWVKTNHLDLGQKTDKDDAASQAAADMAALRAMPGVKSVAMTNSLPLLHRSMSTVVYRQPGDKNSALNNVIVYAGTPGALDTLGVKLVEGRDFKRQEYVDYKPFDQSSIPSTAVILTRTMADELWPGADPIGKPLWLDEKGNKVMHVVGVIGHLLNPSINKYNGAQKNMWLPVSTIQFNAMYVLRVAPQARAKIKLDAPDVLKQINPARMVDAHIYTDTIAKYFRGDRAMIWLLVVVIGCLLALTALGVVGLSSFWVQQRTHTIGIRRAIGATRRDILRYFLTENLLIVSLGVVVGLAGAVGLNLWLMQHYELHRMPLIWLPAGALVLLGLGQLAVLGPALRASKVPPVVATRSV